MLEVGVGWLGVGHLVNERALVLQLRLRLRLAVCCCCLAIPCCCRCGGRPILCLRLAIPLLPVPCGAAILRLLLLLGCGLAIAS